MELNNLETELQLGNEDIQLKGILAIPPNAKGMVLFAHGSGSGRMSPRNNFVARQLQENSLGTLLIDLLTEEEAQDRSNVFDIELLAQRLCIAKQWLQNNQNTSALKIAYFGASTGAGAALVAAVKSPDALFAIVSRGGRPDLAGAYLKEVQIPSLLLVGGNDTVVIGLNQEAFERLSCAKELKIIPGATHLFEEAGALEAVTLEATQWFLRFLQV